METFALFATWEKSRIEVVHGLELNGTIQEEGSIMEHIVEKNILSVSGSMLGNQLEMSKSLTAGSFIKHSRRSDAFLSFLDALRKKYSLVAEGELFNQKSISISGKIVEEVGFKKIEKQLSNLSQLRVVLLNGLCIAGLEAQPFSSFDSFQKSIQSIIAFDLHIVELDLSKNLLEDFADVVGICCALQQTLRVLKLNVITTAVRQNAELAYLNSIASEIVAMPTLEGKDRIKGALNPRFAELCAKYGEPDILSQSTKAAVAAAAANGGEEDGKSVFSPKTLGARLLVCNFYMEDKAEAGGMIRKTKEVPKTVDIYRLKGIAGRLFGMNPVRFSLVWERDERLESPDRLDDYNAVGDGAADWDERMNDGAVYNARFVSLREGSQEIGFYIEDREANIRVKPTVS
ncbi:MAG: hypothetical protein Q9167_007717 [Letrouitia subvulpina]